MGELYNENLFAAPQLFNSWGSLYALSLATAGILQVRNTFMVDRETRKDCISKQAVLFSGYTLYICTSQEEELVLFPFKTTKQKVFDCFSL